MPRQRSRSISANPFNDKLTTSLRLTVTKAVEEQPAGVANSGYWGIPVHAEGTRYRASILARADASFSGPVTVSIVSEDGRTVYASGKVFRSHGGMEKIRSDAQDRQSDSHGQGAFRASRWISRERSGSVSCHFSRRRGTTVRTACART